MKKERVETGEAPQAIGPYSQGISAGEWLFTAGQIGLDPGTGELVEGIAAQAQRALANVGAILEAGGCSWRDVVKTTVYLKDLSDFAVVNAIYAEVVAAPHPARSTIEAAGLPKDALVEIDAIAFRRRREGG
jgi:2-iminobutanoate/2-iminopropanoate deaminase